MFSIVRLLQEQNRHSRICRSPSPDLQDHVQLCSTEVVVDEFSRSCSTEFTITGFADRLWRSSERSLLEVTAHIRPSADRRGSRHRRKNSSGPPLEIPLWSLPETATPQPLRYILLCSHATLGLELQHLFLLYLSTWATSSPMLSTSAGCYVCASTSRLMSSGTSSPPPQLFATSTTVSTASPASSSMIVSSDTSSSRPRSTLYY